VTNFLAISYGTSILWGVKNASFPLTEPMAVNTGLRNCAACDETESGKPSLDVTPNFKTFTSFDLEL